MNGPDLCAVLREIHFLRDIAEEYVSEIAGISQWVEFPAGKVIFREGDLTSSIYLIVAGSVSLEVCAPGTGCKRIMTVGEGELLGWSPVLEETRLTATARTLSPTQAIQIDARQILTVCEHNPRFGYEFMRRAATALAKRLSATRLQLLNVYGSELPESGAQPGE